MMYDVSFHEISHYFQRDGASPPLRPEVRISYPTKHQFDQIFEGVYQGAGLSHKPWFSVLGNHDWGGFKFDNGLLAVCWQFFFGETVRRQIS